MSTLTRSQRVTRRGLTLYGVLVLVFLSGPLLVIIPMSFSSAGGLQFPPPGWSLQWYEALFSSPAWGSAIRTSLLVGLTSSLVALVLGALAGYGLARGTFRGRGALLAMFLAPMIVPPIVTAVGMYLTFTQVGLQGTLVGITAGHVVILVPYVVLLMSVAFESLDRRLELMARSLGASWTTAFRLVLLPLLAPSIAVSWLIALVTSFDEVIVTIFIGGTTDTVPTLMFNQLRDRIDPTVTALSTLLVLVTVLVLAAAGLLLRLGRTRGTEALGDVLTDTTHRGDTP